MKLSNNFHFLLLLFPLLTVKSQIEKQLGKTSSSTIKATSLTNGNVLLISTSQNPTYSLMNLFNENGTSVSNHKISQRYTSASELIELKDENPFQYYMIFNDNSETNKQYFTFFNDNYYSSYKIYLTDKKIIQSSMIHFNNTFSTLSSIYKNEIKKNKSNYFL